MTRPDLASYLDALRAIVDGGLRDALPDRLAPDTIVAAMRYALSGPGKRLRPCLTLAVAEAVGSRRGVGASAAHARALPSACAVELVHTYSLVHDDLPAMDDDTLRRGRPTTHVVYGDGMAVLAGDGLLTEAFALLARASNGQRVDAGSALRHLRAVSVLAVAAGAIGMVGGQAIDLAAAGRVADSVAPIGPLDADGLEDMHARKTGALIVAAAVLGAIAVDGDATLVAAIDAYARDLGLAFQIIDDVLDVEGSAAALGKTAGKDAASGKPTYPAFFGVARSRAMAAECVARAKATLDAAALSGRLTELADWSLERRR